MCSRRGAYVRFSHVGRLTAATARAFNGVPELLPFHLRLSFGTLRGNAAKRFFKRLLKTHSGEPRKIVTDKLKSYGVAHRELMSDAVHDTSQYSNNRAELSHQPTRVRERGMRRFKSVQQAQRFFSVHAAVHNLFNLGRHLVSAKNYRYFRSRAFSSWSAAVA